MIEQHWIDKGKEIAGRCWMADTTSLTQVEAATWVDEDIERALEGLPRRERPRARDLTVCAFHEEYLRRGGRIEREPLDRRDPMSNPNEETPTDSQLDPLGLKALDLGPVREALAARITPILVACGYEARFIIVTVIVGARETADLLAVVTANGTDHVVRARGRGDSPESLERALLSDLSLALRQSVEAIEECRSRLADTAFRFRSALTRFAPTLADTRNLKERGLVNKYRVEGSDGHPIVSVCFVLRPGHDAYSDAATAAAPELVNDMRKRGLTVRKFIGWSKAGTPSMDPDPVPVYSEPLPDAVAIVLGVGPGETVPAGGDLGATLPDGVLARRWTRPALLAYAKACEAELPALAADLRRLCGES